MLQATSKDGMPDGADSFIPIVNYSLLQLSAEESRLLWPNLQFISLFRHESRMDGQDDYYLTTLMMSSEFLANLSARDLKIDPNFYAQEYAKAKQLLQRGQQDADLLNLNEESKGASDQSQQQRNQVAPERLNHQIRETSAAGDNQSLKEENIFLKSLLNEFLEKTYRYRNSEFEELRVKELSQIF